MDVDGLRDSDEELRKYLTGLKFKYGSKLELDGRSGKSVNQTGASNQKDIVLEVDTSGNSLQPLSSLPNAIVNSPSSRHTVYHICSLKQQGPGAGDDDDNMESNSKASYGSCSSCRDDTTADKTYHSPASTPYCNHNGASLLESESAMPEPHIEEEFSFTTSLQLEVQKPTEVSTFTDSFNFHNRVDIQLEHCYDDHDESCPADDIRATADAAPIQSSQGASLLALLSTSRSFCEESDRPPSYGCSELLVPDYSAGPQSWRIIDYDDAEDYEASSNDDDELDTEVGVSSASTLGVRLRNEVVTNSENVEGEGKMLDVAMISGYGQDDNCSDDDLGHLPPGQPLSSRSGSSTDLSLPDSPEHYGYDEAVEELEDEDSEHSTTQQQVAEQAIIVDFKEVGQRQMLTHPVIKVGGMPTMVVAGPAVTDSPSAYYFHPFANDAANHSSGLHESEPITQPAVSTAITGDPLDEVDKYPTASTADPHEEDNYLQLHPSIMVGVESAEEVLTVQSDITVLDCRHNVVLEEQETAYHPACENCYSPCDEDEIPYCATTVVQCEHNVSAALQLSSSSTELLIRSDIISCSDDKRRHDEHAVVLEIDESKDDGGWFNNDSPACRWAATALPDAATPSSSISTLLMRSSHESRGLPLAPAAAAAASASYCAEIVTSELLLVPNETSMELSTLTASNYFQSKVAIEDDPSSDAAEQVLHSLSSSPYIALAEHQHETTIPVLYVETTNSTVSLSHQGHKVATTVVEAGDVVTLNKQPLLVHNEAASSLVALKYDETSSGRSNTSSAAVAAAVSSADWNVLNHRLREAGFNGMTLVSNRRCKQQSVGGGEQQAGSCPAAWGRGISCTADYYTEEPQPSLYELFHTLRCVLNEHEGNSKLMRNLITANEDGQRMEEELRARTSVLERSLNKAQQAAEKAKQDAASLTQLQVPRIEATHHQNVTRLKNEVAKWKEAAKSAEHTCSASMKEVQALKECITSLQSAAASTNDSELTTARLRNNQLEASMKAKDKEMDKLRAMYDMFSSKSSTDMAKTLERAFSAEDKLGKLDSEAHHLRNKIVVHEQASLAREKEISSLKAELEEALSIEREAGSCASERANQAEEAVRHLEGEAAGLRSKLSQVEGLLRSSQKDCVKLKEDAEAMRQTAYEEIWRAEDEIRLLHAELTQKNSKVTQLDNAIRSRDRDVARAKEEKEAGKAVERERVKVIEEIAAKLETELTASKVKAAHLEGALRVKDRELERTHEQLRLIKGMEGEVRILGARAEDGTNKLEAEISHLKSQKLQGEATLKGRDREIERLGKIVDQMKAEMHEATHKFAQASEAAKQAEVEASQCRSRALHLDGSLKVKERELERLSRLLEATRLAESEGQGKLARSEEATRKLECELASLRARHVQLEGSLKTKSAQVERLNKLIDSTRTSEYESTADLLKSEATAKKLDSDLSGLTRRLQQFEAGLKSRDKEIEKQKRLIEQARVETAEAELRRTAAEVARGEVEQSLAAVTKRAVQAEGLVKVREKDLERLQRTTDQLRSAEVLLESKGSELESTSMSLSEELQALSRKLVQAESAAKSHEREVERLSKAAEEQREVAADRIIKLSEAESVAKKLEGDCANLRVKVAQLETTIKTRDRQVEKLERCVASAESRTAESELLWSQASASVKDAESESASLRQQLLQSQSSLKQKDKEVERLQRVLDGTKVSGAENFDKVLEAEAEVREATQSLSSLRQQLVHADGALKSREREVERLSRVVDAAKAAEAQAGYDKLQADKATELLASDLQLSNKRIQHLESQLKSKMRDMEGLQRCLEEAKGLGASSMLQIERFEAERGELESALSAARLRINQLDGQSKQWVMNEDRLRKALATASADASLVAARSQERISEFEQNMIQMRTQLQKLHSSLKSKDNQIQRLNAQLVASQSSKSSQMDQSYERRDGAARQLHSDVATLRSRLQHVDTALKIRDKEVARLGKALEEARCLNMEVSQRCEDIEAASRQVDVKVHAIRSRWVAAESGVRSRQRRCGLLEAQLKEARSLQYAAESAKLQAEEAARQLNSDVTSARQQLVISEQSARSRSKDMERLRKQVDHLKSAEQDAVDQGVHADHLAMQLDRDLAAMRRRLVALEGGVKAKDVAIQSMAMQIDRNKSSEAEVAAKQEQTEEAFRQLDQDLSALAQRSTVLEGSLRSKDKELERVLRKLEESEVAAATAEGEQIKAEESVRKSESDLMSVKQQHKMLENLLKTREKDLENSRKELLSVNAALSKETSHSQNIEDMHQELLSQLEAAKVQHHQLQGSIRSAEKESEKFKGIAESMKTAYQALETSKADVEKEREATRQEVVSLKSKVLALEASLASAERQGDRILKQSEALRNAEHRAVSDALMGTEDTAKLLQSELEDLRQQVVHLGSASRSKDREVEKFRKLHSAVQVKLLEEEDQKQVAQRKTLMMEADVATLRSKVLQLEGSSKVKEKEAAKLERAIEQRKEIEDQLRVQVVAAEQALKSVEHEAATLRGRSGHLEGVIKVKDREIERLCKSLETAKESCYLAHSQQLQAEDLARSLENQVVTLQSNVLHLQGLLKSRDKDLAVVRKQMDNLESGENNVLGKKLQAEEAAKKLDTDVVLLRQRVVQLEGTLKSREKDIDRFQGMVNDASVAATEKAREHQELIRKLESDLATVRQQSVTTESSCRAKDGQLARLQHMLEQTKASELEFSAKYSKAKGDVHAADLEVEKVALQVKQRDTAIKARDAEITRLTTLVSKLEDVRHDAQVGEDRSQLQLTEVERDVATLRAQLLKEEGEVRAGQSALKEAQRMLEKEKGFTAEKTMMADKAQGLVKDMETSTAQLKLRVSSLEQALKNKDAESERLSKQVVAMQSNIELREERVAERAADGQAKLEAKLGQAHVRISQLESSSITKDKEIEGLQRMLDSANSRRAVASDIASATSGLSLTDVARGGNGGKQEAVQKLEMELAATKTRLVHVEHVARSREVAVDKIKTVLADKVTKEERRVARDKMTYNALKQAWLVNKSDPLGRSAAGAVAAASREMRAVEIVGIYEAQREGLEAELNAAKKEVRYLSEQLRDAQNLIAVKDRQDAWRGPQHLASLQGRVMVSEQKATEIQRQLDDSRASAVNALRGMQARLDVAEERCKVTAEELAVVRAELQGRPTVEETRSLLNEISILERRVMELRNSGPGSSGAAGEDATSLRALQARRLTGGRDMIRRDKELHRLGLRDVRDLSRDVLVEIVQDACLELEVSEATALPEAIKKLQSILTAAPKMEEWIGRVCNHMFGLHRTAGMQSSKEDVRYEGRPADGVPEFTLYSILTALPAASHALTASVKEAAEQRDPSCVPQLLVACISALKDTCTMREVLVAISQALSSRSHPIARVSLRTPGDVVNAVRELVALEGSSLSSREAMALAEEALLSSSSLSSTSSSQQRDQLAADGTAASVQHNAVLDSTSGDDAAHRVLAGLVKRFMQLFDCASLVGVMATMNKVYMTFSEQRNFLTELVGALEEVDGIHSQEAPSGLTTIMSRVRTAVNELLALKQRGQQYSSSKLTLETDGEGGTSRTLSKGYKHTDFVHGTTAHGGDTKEEEEKEICNQIVTILGASNVQQAVILAERLVGRLRRLDSVLPRYQRVASQLFETLRVQGLEDIVPAVLRLQSIISSS